jgi:hypothetical protein
MLQTVLAKIDKHLGTNIPFNIQGNTVIHGKDTFIVKPGHMDEFLRIRLAKYTLLLENIENKNSNIGIFLQKWNALSLESRQHYD